LPPLSRRCSGSGRSNKLRTIARRNSTSSSSSSLFSASSSLLYQPSSSLLSSSSSESEPSGTELFAALYRVWAAARASLSSAESWRSCKFLVASLYRALAVARASDSSGCEDMFPPEVLAEGGSEGAFLLNSIEIGTKGPGSPGRLRRFGLVVGGGGSKIFSFFFGSGCLSSFTFRLES
jgi:hypothetical protein